MFEHTDRALTSYASNAGVRGGRKIHSFIGAVITRDHITNRGALSASKHGHGHERWQEYVPYRRIDQAMQSWFA